MKAEAWIFGACSIFLVPLAPLYWFIAEDPTGTSALVMTALLTSMVTFYLTLHARRMDKAGTLRPEDNLDGEIADGAGELGFFPPYSWWPLWCGLALGLIVLGLALAAWFMAVIGAVFGIGAACGWIFEYYRGEFAH